ncbi:hypothetical protein E8L99_12005 [Phreatobacter aquaticus]|uniref:Uncharacterized protein n=1 Tax=Phreatobacter aquaticus TaxID=2570229 RepID=A0A4D7QLZ1_9HYPH|nr:hypothetical protein [Phreatobacter aquaticus]QCK86426.1 hypothetical protein E8L99_12005 [Phreatobacter aquaticus]
MMPDVVAERVLPMDLRNTEFRAMLIDKGFRWVTIERRSPDGRFTSMHKCERLAERAARSSNRIVVNLETGDFG